MLTDSLQWIHRIASPKEDGVGGDGQDRAGAVVLEHSGGTQQRAAGGNHVVKQDRRLALDRAANEVRLVGGDQPGIKPEL